MTYIFHPSVLYGVYVWRPSWNPSKWSARWLTMSIPRLTPGGWDVTPGGWDVALGGKRHVTGERAKC